VRAEDVVVEPISVGLAGGHVMDIGAVVGVVRLVGSTGFSSAVVAIAFVLDATHGGTEVSDVWCISEP
jgi:hypothetical protein